MINKMKVSAVGLFLFTLHSSLFTLLQAETISTQKIAFVDIEKIYSKFKMKELAEKELDAREENYRKKAEEIDQKIRALEAGRSIEMNRPAVQKVIVSTVATEDFGEDIQMSTAAASDVGLLPAAGAQETPEISTAAAPSPPPPSGPSVEEQIEELSKEKEELSKEAESKLDLMKGEFTAQIMGHIYDAVKEVAAAGGYNVVIDKSNCLYGIPETDLTEEVLEKLK